MKREYKRFYGAIFMRSHTALRIENIESAELCKINFTVHYLHTLTSKACTFKKSPALLHLIAYYYCIRFKCPTILIKNS